MGAADAPQPWEPHTTAHSLLNTMKTFSREKIVKNKPHLTHFRLVITEGPIEQERPATQKATDLSTAYSKRIK